MRRENSCATIEKNGLSRPTERLVAYPGVSFLITKVGKPACVSQTLANWVRII
jgi:hypothetical protein